MDSDIKRIKNKMIRKIFIIADDNEDIYYETADYSKEACLELCYKNLWNKDEIEDYGGRVVCIRGYLEEVE